MRTSVSVGSILFTFLITTAGCYYDKEQLLYGGGATVSCTTVSAKFSTDVKTIIQNKCATAGCHNAAAASGGAVLETYAQVAALSARIKQRALVDKTMPSAGPLLPAEIAVVRCWIDSGAPNN